MLRRPGLIALVALACAAPVLAEDGEKRAHELHFAGTVVRASDAAVVVENSFGDLVLTCTVPDRLAEQAGALTAGERVKVTCVRRNGRKAQLLKIRSAERPAKPQKPEQPAGEEVRIYGSIAELSREAVTVRGEAGTLTCRVPAGIAEKLVRFAVGDAVKMMCRGAELTYLEKTA